MRRAAAILFALAVMHPLGVIDSSPAGAAGGTTCQAASGSATFKPALPKLGSKVKVAATVKVTGGKLSGCVGGGVTSGVVKLTSKFAKSLNCETLAKQGSTNPTKGTEVITWNNKKTSTISVTLTGVKTSPKQARIAGTVTAGLFKGSKQSGTVEYIPPKGGCTSKGLSVATFKHVTPQVIK